jgi:hypothetical protein
MRLPSGMHPMPARSTKDQAIRACLRPSPLLQRRLAMQAGSPQ